MRTLKKCHLRSTYYADLVIHLITVTADALLSPRLQPQRHRMFRKAHRQEVMLSVDENNAHFRRRLLDPSFLD